MIGLSGISVVDKLIFAVAVSAQGLLINAAAHCAPDDMVQRIAVVDEDGRMTEEEYARSKGKPIAEVQDRFAATGVLDCPNSQGSAQLTGKNDIITSSGHVLRDRDSCKTLNLFSHCNFVAKNSKATQRIRVESVLAAGDLCSKTLGKRDDWVILKLKEPVTGISPYLTPKVWERPVAYERVISVAGVAIEFYRFDATGKKVFPKSIDECEIRKVWPAEWFMTTCDISSGASGGSVLRPSEKGDVLIGLHEGRFGASGKIANEAGHYHEFKWSTYHAPVSGPFLVALEKVLGISPPGL